MITLGLLHFNALILLKPSQIFPFILLLYHPPSLSQAQAKARVKAQIEQDKRERAEKFAREKALRDGTLPTTEATPVLVAKPSASIGTSTAGKDSKESRLRVRGSEGMWMGTLDAEATLGDVEAKMRQEGKASGALKVSKEKRGGRVEVSLRDLFLEFTC